MESLLHICNTLRKILISLHPLLKLCETELQFTLQYIAKSIQPSHFLQNTKLFKKFKMESFCLQSARKEIWRSQQSQQFLRDCKKIIDSYEAQVISSERKCCHLSSHPELDDALLKWFSQAQTDNIQISGQQLLAKANNWMENVLPQLLRQYKPENIYNADETGLFWHLTPQKSLVFKNEKCFGGKKSGSLFYVQLTWQVSICIC